MPPRKPRPVPGYRLHRASGNAVVTLNGKDHYLGRHGSPESRTRYDREVAAWIARGRVPKEQAMSGSVQSLIVAYISHSRDYYVKGGFPTSRLSIILVAMTAVAVHCGNAHVADVGPTDLVAIRDGWVKAGLARVTANNYAAVVVDLFRWGVESGIVPASVWHGLKAVKGLARGRCGAREPAAVGVVAMAEIDAVVAVATPKLADMIRLQLLTGMRPGEVANIRAAEVDRGDRVWIYRPSVHKTEHHDRPRVVAIGPKGQAILGPWIDRAGPGATVFPKCPDRGGKPRAALRPDQILTRSYSREVQRALRQGRHRPLDSQPAPAHGRDGDPQGPQDRVGLDDPRACEDGHDRNLRRERPRRR